MTQQNPLAWNVPIVDPHGRPTKEFMQKWATQRAINGSIPSLSTSDEVSDVLDLLSSSPGSLLIRGGSKWEPLASPGDATKYLNGAGSYSTPPDTTYGVVTTSSDGLAPQLSGDATEFLDGTGNYSAPAGGGGGDYTKIGEVITTASQATVTFSSIPATHRNLKLSYTAKSTTTSSDDIQLNMTFNGDTGSNYSYNRAFISTAGVVTGTVINAAFIGITQITTLKASNNALEFNSGEFTILNYADATKWRELFATASNTNAVSSLRTMTGVGRWQNASAAISSISFALALGNFVDGSVFSLYGIG